MLLHVLSKKVKTVIDHTSNYTVVKIGLILSYTYQIVHLNEHRGSVRLKD